MSRWDSRTVPASARRNGRAVVMVPGCRTIDPFANMAVDLEEQVRTDSQVARCGLKCRRWML